MSHQSNKGEKENVESQLGHSAVSDISIISTLNKLTKETTNKKRNKSKKQIIKKKIDVKRRKVYKPETNQEICDPKTNLVGKICEPSPVQIDAN
ncbi:hypothetical protein HHI36_012859, partial [Cryptolaemus montrouzieri]